MTSLSRQAACLLALLAAACAPAAQAGDPPAPADPTDAAAPVPRTVYQSALRPARAAPAPGSPTLEWQALNQLVGAYDSMALTSDGQGDAAGAAAPAAAAPPSRNAQAALPDPHAGHRPRAVH